MMDGKGTEHERGSLNRSKHLFVLTYAVIILLGCMSLYLLYRVNGLEAANENFFIALENSGKNETEDYNREFLRNKRSNYRRTSTKTAPPGLASAHLIGHQEGRLFRGQWLTWCFSNCIQSTSKNTTACMSTLSHSQFCVSSDQHTIRIAKAGYYFVYTQLVTTSKSNAIKSFQIAVRPGGVIDDAYPVMSSYKTQYPLGFTADHVPISSKDTVYVGGVVFFCPDDLIGVRANPDNAEDITLDTSNDGSAFFGALIVNEIPKQVVYRYCTREA